MPVLKTPMECLENEELRVKVWVVYRETALNLRGIDSLL